MKNEEKIKDIYNKTYKQCLEDGYSEEITKACAIMSKTGAEIMADWKDRQCLATLLRVFDLIVNKRDAGEALEYIKEVLEFIIKDHYGDAYNNKTNQIIMKSYCNLNCIGNSENCISLAPCKGYSNIINIFDAIDNLHKYNIYKIN